MARSSSTLLRPALLIALAILGLFSTAQAQGRRHYRHHANGSNTSFWNGTAISTPDVADPDDEDYVRNYGTGVKLGAAWSGFRKGFEFGAFHQQRLGQVGSLQGEVLYYRQPTATGTVGGVRVPALLVLNPFDNGSIHFGPQFQWQPKSTPVADGSTALATTQITTSMVMGAELRLYIARVGMRFALPFSAFTEPQNGAHQLADQWKTGQMQVYLGVNIK